MSDPVWAAVTGLLFGAAVGLTIWTMRECARWDRAAKKLLAEMRQTQADTEALMREMGFLAADKE